MALDVKFDQGNLIEREAKLRKLRASIFRAVRDPQSMNFAAFNYRHHLENMGMGKTANMTQVKTYMKLGQMASLFPKNDDVMEFGDVLERNRRWSKEKIIATENNLKAFFNPHGVIEAVVSGQRPVSHDEMKVVRQVHPELFSKMRNVIMMGVNTGNMKLTRQQQLRLGIFLDMPTDSSQTGPYMEVTNLIHGQAAQRQGANRTATQASLGAMSNIQTDMQRRASRGL